MPPEKGVTPPLPATAADVNDLATFNSTVKALTLAIIRAVNDGKSVTAGNKRHITLAAEEIRRSVFALGLIYPLAPTATLEPTAAQAATAATAATGPTAAPARTAATAAPAPTAVSAHTAAPARTAATAAPAPTAVSAPTAAPAHTAATAAPAPTAVSAPTAPPAHTAATAAPVPTAAPAPTAASAPTAAPALTAATAAPAPPAGSELAGIREVIVACVRAEFVKLKAELSPHSRLTAEPAPSGPTYAQATRAHQKRAPAPAKKPPPPTRPAIIIGTKTETSTRQQAVEAFRRSISFRTSDYAPTRVQPVSHNKLRVEFETAQQRDDALLRLADASEITAERARLRQPMLLLKGISKTTPREELVGIIRAQNACADGDLSLKFIRNNKNDALYNAVLSANPEAWRRLVGLGRVCVDHQRVHAERFSPFLQCFSCLQFGHVRKDCRPDAAKPCALCASTDHQEPDCPDKSDSGCLKCFNCANLNLKFNGTAKTNHKATSGSCPVVRGMRARVESRVDYGTP